MFYSVLYPLSLVLLFLVAGARYSTALKAELVGKLPRSTAGAAAIYDGKNFVYIIGGTLVPGNTQIYQYCLTSNKFTEVGRFPCTVSHGSAGQDSSGDVYYFGGIGCTYAGHDSFGDQTLWKLNSTYSNPQNIASVPNHEAYSNLAGFSESKWYLIGGIYADGKPSPVISNFKIAKEKLKPVANLPVAVSGVSSAVFGDHVYIFGGDHQGYGDYEQDNIKYITKFTPETNEVEQLDLELHLGIVGSSAVTVANHIYIIGGGRYNSQGGEQHSVSRFTPSRDSVEHIVLDNLPAGLMQAATVYIPKKGIYTFGGYDSKGKRYSDVYRIKL